ncbi:hypothetical protein DXG01_002079 [Tephrocybe rancida]|nr:hypothetical protein DXG01_002079 [Tephrocybe rancida]
MPPSARTRTTQPLRRQNAFIYIPGMGVFPPEAASQYYGLSPLDEPQLAMGLPRQAVTPRISTKLMFNGLIISAALDSNNRDVLKSAEDAFTPEDMRQYETYCQLARLYPSLEQIVMDGSEDDVSGMAKTIQRAIAGANMDDIRSLRPNVLLWITPPNTQLSPPLHGDIKFNRGFHHTVTVRDALESRKLDFASYWPYFVFRDHIYCPEDPWAGLLQSTLLVEVEAVPEVTLPLIAYIAVQVRYALSSETVFFSRDARSESQTFYEFMLNFFDLHKKDTRLQNILAWWTE